MACKTSFELHHHFPKLAEESGFTFNTHRPRVHIDWNKIRLIDIESLIRERKFVVIEQHLNDILDCVLESEFDVRILDDGVMKMFRLAQLSVEYQQFCRHYLDRSVYVLREEITSMARDLDAAKKEIHEKDEEIRRLRKRNKHSFKTPLPYGNDNIATMILKTLSNKSDIFPSTSNEDNLHYNKCKYCDKVFLNQLYLKSHISRRHADVMEMSQNPENYHNETTKLSSEIMELKTKLRDMEVLMTTNSNSQVNSTAVRQIESQIDKHNDHNVKKDMKDAEVLTSNDEYLLGKIEQWKKEEHEKYSKELNNLRNQIMETVNTLKQNEIQPSIHKDTHVMEQLNSTIIQQSAEILTLKQELINYKQVREKESTERSKETEAQISFWAHRAETQSKLYDALLQKLNDVAQDAKESRALAEAEKERAGQLQALLQQTLDNKAPAIVTPAPSSFVISNDNNIKCDQNKKKNYKSHQITDRKTLENLHRKAQELLNISSITSSSSDTSNGLPEKTIPINSKAKDKRVKKGTVQVNNKLQLRDIVHKSTSEYRNQDETHESNPSKSRNKEALHEVIKPKKQKLKNDVSQARSKVVRDNTLNISPGSPLKVVRAKITEEVNNRLVSVGVDPLKSRLPKSDFQKQRLQLQHILDLKSKKNPAFEKERYFILSCLDSKTSDLKIQATSSHEYISPKKTNKPLRSVSSVLSNVKTKALSLVKLNDRTIKDGRTSLNSDVAKRAMSLLKTPPGSTQTSPASRQRPDKHSDSAQDPARSSSNSNYQKTAVDKNCSQIVKESLTNATLANDTASDSNESDHKYYNATIPPQSSKSIENLIKSPARRPSSADIDRNHAHKYTIASSDLYIRTQSETNISEIRPESNKSGKPSNLNTDNSSSEGEEFLDNPYKASDDIINIKQTKGVLKSASSVSSLNKKKVLFDMDAIQMKSVSASPSQSITEKYDTTKQHELGVINLDTDEWDISSIENEPLEKDTKNQIKSRTGPKIAQLKQTIESQLARRKETPPTAIVGAVDVLTGPRIQAPSIGGSNTSLGSSILDDSDSIPGIKLKAIVRPKKGTEKDDSELDISEFSIDGIPKKNESF